MNLNIKLCIFINKLEMKNFFSKDSNTNLDNEIINKEGSIHDELIDEQEEKISIKSGKEVNKYFNRKVIAIYYSFTFSTLFNTISFFENFHISWPF